jgi:anti-sigma regulatory factor (Ser/Thr protein kinase)
VGEVLDVRKTRRAEWTFPAAPRTVPAARSAVVARLTEWGMDGVRDTAALLVTELVTNAVCHGRGGSVDLRLLGPGDDVPATLRIEVGDEEPLPPRRRPDVRPEDESGRGLMLLAYCARAWGVRPRPRGKAVWFELTLPG